jgi:hypothetical protein
MWILDDVNGCLEPESSQDAAMDLCEMCFQFLNQRHTLNSETKRSMESALAKCMIKKWSPHAI